MILFDFDGVILDSVRESAVTAFGAVTGEVATGLSDLPAGVGELFIRNRFHFQPAGDALLLMEWCLEQCAGPSSTGVGEKPGPGSDRIMSGPEYRAEVLSRGVKPLKERTEQFFAARQRFIAKDVKRWVEMNAVYQPLFDYLVGYGGARLVILTNKNRAATVDLMRHFGLELESANVYSGDHGVTKQENLEQIAHRFSEREYLFIDDSIGNLCEVTEFAQGHGIPVRGALATWGYIGSGDRALAARHGFGVFEQRDLIAVLSGG